MGALLVSYLPDANNRADWSLLQGAGKEVTTGQAAEVTVVQAGIGKEVRHHAAEQGI